MVRFYVSEEPILENVQTYLPTDDATRRQVLRRLDQLVIKPTSESGGKGEFSPEHPEARPDRPGAVLARP